MRTRVKSPISFDMFANDIHDPLRKSFIQSIDVKTKKVYFTAESQECEFFRFIRNTSDFYGLQKEGRAPDEDMEICILNKMTALGYLLRRYVPDPLRRIVFAYDEGRSGPSGKSLFAKSISYVVPQVHVDGRICLRKVSTYALQDVTGDTRNILIDDFPQDVRFTQLKQCIAGDLTVRRQCLPELSIPYQQAPRILATSNEGPDNLRISTRNLRHFVRVPFSDWYNDRHHPVDDFGHAMFLSWDKHQWSLFDVFMADCVMLHYCSVQNNWAPETSGIVEAQTLPF